MTWKWISINGRTAHLASKVHYQALCGTIPRARLGAERPEARITVPACRKCVSAAERYFPDQDLVGLRPVRVRQAQRDHAKLLRLYGKTDGQECKNCQHFRRHRNWAKCGLTNYTGGPGTDWGALWVACGKFEEVTDEDSV